MTSRARSVIKARADLVAERIAPPRAFGAPGRPQEVVVKATGFAKSRDSVRNMIRYIGRLREEDRENGLFGTVPLRDGAGAGVSGEAVGAVLDAWGVMSDPDNLSAAAAAREDRGAALSETERLRHSQAVHLTWSVNAEQTGLAAARVKAAMERATLALIDEMFTARGIPVIWGLHDEHADPQERRNPERREHTHPHVHIVAPFMPRGARPWRLTRGMSEELRHAAARHGREQGLDLKATRREDREDLVAEILGGAAPLRRRGRQKNARAGGGPAEMARKAPLWFVEFGVGYEKRKRVLAEIRRRVAGAPRGRGETATADRVNAEMAKELTEGGFAARAAGALSDRMRARSLPPELAALREAVKGSFVDPAAAVISFWRLAVEGAHRTDRGLWRLPNLASARWHMINRPDAFGVIGPAGLGHAVRNDLKELLKTLRPPVREELVRGRFEADPEALAAALGEAEAVNAAAKVSRAKDVILRGTMELAELTETVLEDPHRAGKIRARAAEIAATVPGDPSEKPKDRGRVPDTARDVKSPPSRRAPARR